ncbi:MAG: hypothetical protein EAZ87_04330 [Nostocales cyanobacterium]|nr:MAG: hypothetical protein EAZ87_04330 [Nostocales cyanobacterium]
MKIYDIQKTITVITLTLLTVSCEARENETTANSVKQPVNNPVNVNNIFNNSPNITYGDLIIQKSSDYIMIPVNLPDQEQDANLDLNLSRSYERDKKTYNMIFYHQKTGETQLLLDKKAIIKDYKLLEIKSKDKPNKEFWLFQIIDKDTNKDQKLNNQDAVIGYISDLSGKNFKQITPDNTQLINWVILPSENAILLKIIKDSNQDLKFTDPDNTNFVRVNLEKPEIGKEIIPNELESKIKSYVIK